jgi:hypothetical protein
MGCVLRVWGKNFDVDAFLKVSSFEPLTVWHTGESRPSPSNLAGRRHQHSGMHISVSVREFSDLTGQIEDAVSFLETYGEELLRLRGFPGNEGTVLDFPVEDRDVAVQTDTFPPELLVLLGNLSIMLAISRYPIPTNHRS